MRQTVAGVAAVLLLTPALLAAQVRPSDARSARDVRSESPIVRPTCNLAGESGIVLSFAVCPARSGSGTTREVEIVEYRDGDSPMQVARVTVRGVVRGDLDALHIGTTDPDDDGDGLPALEARRAGGRMKVGRVTLRRTELAGATGLPWEGDGDTDGDGFPMTVDLREPSGGTTTLTLGKCRAVPGTEPAAEVVSLTCREVRMVAATESSPYARFVARAMERPDRALPLVDHRMPSTATSAAAVTRGATQSTRAFRLEGARLENWSVDFDSRSGTGSWTLEMRVDRIEMG